jgi:microsomal dipeptidase-like Zn-dependent dipeptidase
MLVDLHAHYPMHVVGRIALDELFSRAGRRTLREHLREAIVDVAGVLANYEGEHHAPGVTIDRLVEGGVRVVLSPTYAAFDELDGLFHRNLPAKPSYIHSIEHQIEDVEASFADDPRVAVARNLADLADATARDVPVCFIHCVEGGHALGSDPARVPHNVARLRELGVAYVTIAHLLYRVVATNVAAIPSLSDRHYDCMFPQPEGVGLTEAGIAAVRALHDERMLIDVTHMSERSFAQTLALLDEIDRGRRTAVFASHIATRRGKLGSLQYNLGDDAIRRIVERGGVLGMMVCAHFMADGDARPTTWDETVKVVCAQIDHVAKISAEVRGTSTPCFDHVSIGSDLDGFAKPSLAGLGDAGALARLSLALRAAYGDHANAILGDNALRLLRAHWH